MIKAVIFDCFGVVLMDVFDTVYEHFGGDLTKDMEFIKQALYDSCSGKVPSLAPIVAKRLGVEEEVWAKAITEGSSLNKPLLEYVLELRKNYKTAMLSNIGVGGLEWMFEPDLLDIYFDIKVASGDIGYAKPEPEAYEITADRLGVRLDECVFIDDSQPYVDGAIAVGMHAILFTSNVQLKRELERLLKR